MTDCLEEDALVISYTELLIKLREKFVEKRCGNFSKVFSFQDNTPARKSLIDDRGNRFLTNDDVICSFEEKNMKIQRNSNKHIQND